MNSLSSMNDTILGSALDGFGAAVRTYHRRVNESNRRKAMGNAAEAEVWYEYSLELRERFVNYTNYSNRIRRQYEGLIREFNTLVDQLNRLEHIRTDSLRRFESDRANHQHRMRTVQEEAHRMNQMSESIAAQLQRNGVPAEAIQDFLHSQSCMSANRGSGESSIASRWELDGYVADVESALDSCDSFARVDVQDMISSKPEDSYILKRRPHSFAGTQEEVICWQNDAKEVTDRFVKFTTFTEKMKESYIALMRDFNVKLWKLQHAESSIRESFGEYRSENYQQKLLELRAHDLLRKTAAVRDSMNRFRDMNSSA